MAERLRVAPRKASSTRRPRGHMCNFYRSGTASSLHSTYRPGSYNYCTECLAFYTGHLTAIAKKNGCQLVGINLKTNK